MKRFLKFLGYLALFLSAAGVAAYFYYDKPVPEGNSGPQADALAEKVLAALNYADWDSTNYVTWSFLDSHHYVWNKRDNLVRVSWGEKEVILSTDSPFEGAIVRPVNSAPAENESATQDAWSYFCNDSFWLIAPYKLFDSGTSRSIVESADGKESLMVTYSSGGVTPGDKYLWHLNGQYVPTSFQMWVNIIPIGGLEATWENWTETATGAKISHTHSFSGLSLELTDIATGNSLTQLGLDSTLFDGFNY
ncbi:MAG: hypothetical protein ACI8TS_002112 [Flavobacteriales bacterium]|jgi:hypothetical protein